MQLVLIGLGLPSSYDVSLSATGVALFLILYSSLGCCCRMPLGCKVAASTLPRKADAVSVASQ